VKKAKSRHPKKSGPTKKGPIFLFVYKLLRKGKARRTKGRQGWYEKTYEMAEKGEN